MGRKRDQWFPGVGWWGKRGGMGQLLAGTILYGTGVVDT